MDKINLQQKKVLQAVQAEIGKQIQRVDQRKRGRRSRKKGEYEQRQTGKQEVIAYVYKDNAIGVELPILNSANGWWLDKTKLQKLVDAYKFYLTDDQAVFYTGISLTQLKYFQDLHPDFYTLKHLARQYPGIQAKMKIVAELSKNPYLSQWWLQVTEKETFSTRIETQNTDRDQYDLLTQKYKKLTEEIQAGYDIPTEGPSDAPTGDEGDRPTPATTDN